MNFLTTALGSDHDDKTTLAFFAVKMRFRVLDPPTLEVENIHIMSNITWIVT